jgi:large subunit ribosomal protein L28
LREQSLTVTSNFCSTTPKAFASKSLDNQRVRGTFCALIFAMSKVCTITGSRPTRGSVIRRRGMAKKKGGVGRHVTKMVPRLFAPNLHQHRIWVPELKKFVRVRVTARGLKTINKNGAYKALKKAGTI